MSSTSDGTGTTARVLRLLDLLQSRPVWSGTELADRLGVTTRSVRRDVDRLRDLGYPVNAAHGAGGGYQLGAGRRLPPLLLDDDEAVAIAVCLRLAAGGTVEGLGEAAVRTLAKLDQVLPARLRSQVEAIHEATVTLDSGVAPVDAATLLLLARACRETERVTFAYAGPRGSGERRRRALPPRRHRTPVVPARLRPRPRRLAHLPARPHDRRAVTRLALPAPRGARRGRARAALDLRRGLRPCLPGSHRGAEVVGGASTFPPRSAR